MLIIDDPNSVLVSIIVDKTQQEEKYAIAYSGADWEHEFKFGDIVSANEIDQLLAKEGTVWVNSPIVYI
jgi:hypothetical protein